MKAIEALKQINDICSEIVSMTKDYNGDVTCYTSKNLEKIYNDKNSYWGFAEYPTKCMKISQKFASEIEWMSENWDECIVTL